MANSNHWKSDIKVQSPKISLVLNDNFTGKLKNILLERRAGSEPASLAALSLKHGLGKCLQEGYQSTVKNTPAWHLNFKVNASV